MARNMADHKIADHLREEAAQYLQEADEAEMGQRSSAFPGG
jgi:hypothetical protein